MSETTISSDALLLLSALVVRELMRTLRESQTLTETQEHDILARAVAQLHRTTLGLGAQDVDNLVAVLMGRPITMPKENLN